jgi:asparagine synthase (glutamine-hydrolysing)
MVEAQVHRGPDDSGFFGDDVVALGHRRLSIIDTSSAGRQPIVDESGTIRTIFNGEIYNHKELRRQLLRDHHFSSLTDPEVLVHGCEQWGLDGLLERISGMFSFALYDSRRRTLVLARDRFGIKPLYYALNSSGTALAFASEIRALRVGGFTGCSADIEGIAGFLLFGSTPSPQTTFKAVSCLPPAHYLLCTGGTWSLHRYWTADRTPQPASGEDTNELAHAIENSVALHLNSDVPIGFFLGGGVDSTALIAIARRVQQNICTLTVALDDHALNEAADAGEAARHFASDHREIRISQSDLSRAFPDYLDAMDQPTVDGLNTFLISRAARIAGLKVVLSGVGGDEVFRGYRHYRWLSRGRRLLRIAAAAPGGMRAVAVAAADRYARFFGREKWSRLGSLAGAVDPPALYAMLRGFFPVREVSLLTGIPEARLFDYSAACLSDRGDPPVNLSVEDAFNAIEMSRYLHDQLLRDTDVFSMAQSIEVRVPYLDHNLVNCAFQAPDLNNATAALNKPALVRAVNDPVVTRAAGRRKRGFVLPIEKWLRESPGLRSRVMANSVIDADHAGRLWSEFERGRLHWSRAMALVVLSSRQ